MMAKLRNLGQVFGENRGPWERRLLIWGGIFVVGAVVVITAAYYFDVVTESDWFCGELCHPNNPEFVTHEVSPHANVECGACHIGPGLTPKVMAKVYGVGELVSLIANTYERPIDLPVERMRPAKEVCEQCHWPGYAEEEQVHRISAFAADEQNSETVTSLVLRISEYGDGEGHGGTEQHGIHWHASSQVLYVAGDEESQDIPWVGVVGDDGALVEYVATDISNTAEELEDLPREEMDCMVCHNRATHRFRKPERLVDEALAAGVLDRDLPFLKREAMRVLSASYSTQEDGVKAVEGVAEFYRSEYADVSAARQEAVDRAVEVIQEIYRQTTFPAMNLTWDSYPDNLGHLDSPGCFRCHDGKHVNAQQEAIPSNCTLCHSVPVTIQPDQAAAKRVDLGWAVEPSEKPTSHKPAGFTRQHRVLADESCVDCHGAIEYGVDNTSFCANGACHGQEWLGVDLDAGFVHPVELAGPHATAVCSQCHQGDARPSFDDCATCHTPEPMPHFGSECGQCHTMDGWRESAVSWRSDAPANPHGVEEINCLLCHAESGASPAPATHREISSDQCVDCHPSTVVASIPSIPHPEGEPDACLTCHGEGNLEPASATHRGISVDLCARCHESVPVEGAPAVSHKGQGYEVCLACHDVDKLKPAPASHEGWPGESCTLCHEPGPTA